RSPAYRSMARPRLPENAALDAIYVTLTRVAASRQDRDAQLAEPGLELRNQAALFDGDVDRVWLPVRVVQLVPPGKPSESILCAADVEGLDDLAALVDQVREEAVAAQLGCATAELLVVSLAVVDDLLGHEPVEKLPQRDAGR